MTIQELYDAARLRVRKTIKDALDADIQRLVDACVADLKRIGVADSWLSAPSDPIIIETVLSYVRANYSVDTSQYPVLSGIYDMNLIRLKGDSKYFSEAVPAASDSSDSGEEGTTI